jgi:hypothetical protein
MKKSKNDATQENHGERTNQRKDDTRKQKVLAPPRKAIADHLPINLGPRQMLRLMS